MGAKALCFLFQVPNCRAVLGDIPNCRWVLSDIAKLRRMLDEVAKLRCRVAAGFLGDVAKLLPGPSCEHWSTQNFERCESAGGWLGGGRGGSGGLPGLRQGGSGGLHGLRQQWACLACTRGEQGGEQDFQAKGKKTTHGARFVFGKKRKCLKMILLGVLLLISCSSLVGQ